MPIIYHPKNAPEKHNCALPAHPALIVEKTIFRCTAVVNNQVCRKYWVVKPSLAGPTRWYPMREAKVKRFWRKLSREEQVWGNIQLVKDRP